MTRETRVSPRQLIWPIFVRDGENIVEPIPSMPGQSRYSVDRLEEPLARALDAGIAGILYFGVPDIAKKNSQGSEAWNENGGVQRAIRYAKAAFPHLLAIADVCLCEYTSHGHCGLLDGETVINDATLPLLARAAVSYAQSGADIVAPSDMMDGRVAAIRHALDEAQYTDRAIMSYAVKYASAFYGPFREAAGSTPGFGDRQGYQMDPHNAREAIKEALLDVDEGADMLIVKPAGPYLDIIRAVKDATHLPLAAYQVSGEYAMLKAAAQNGWIDEARAACESALCAFRAGTDILITYYANELAQWMREGRLG